MKDECICNQCPRRFVCFTQEKVFSDPAYQAMYETYVEEGLKHEVAVKKVREFIEGLASPKHPTPTEDEISRLRDEMERQRGRYDYGKYKEEWWYGENDWQKSVGDDKMRQIEELRRKMSIYDGKSNKS